MPAAPNWLATAAAPLLGVAVGGMLTWLVGVSADRRRAKLDRQAQLESLQREAISAALEWIQVMRSASIRASSLAQSGAYHCNYDADRYARDFPDILTELAKKDLSGAQQAVLPASLDFYSRGQEIVSAFEELELLGISCGERAVVTGRPDGVQEISIQSSRVEQLIDALEGDMGSSFRRTLA